MRWTAHIQGGPARVNHAACAVGDKIYCFGGYSSSTDKYKDWEPIPVYELDTYTLRWKEIIPSFDSPCQRFGHTTVAYKSMVYMWGGRNNSVACVPLCMFNTITLKWSNPRVQGAVPYAKDGHSASLVDDNMFIFGGFEYISDSLTNEIHCLNLNTYMWHIVNPSGPAPSPRDFHSAVTVDGKMYIYGGRSEPVESSTIEEEDIRYSPLLHVYDTVKNEWSLIKVDGKLPVGRRSHSAWYYDGDMYVFGGYNSCNKRHYNTLHKYSFEKNRWYEIKIPGIYPCKRRRQVCVKHEDKVYLFGGTSPTNPDGTMHKFSEMLFDKGDLHILDYGPTLRTIAMMVVINNDLKLDLLPKEIKKDILNMYLNNGISEAEPQFGFRMKM